LNSPHPDDHSELPADQHAGHLITHTDKKTSPKINTTNEHRITAARESPGLSVQSCANPPLTPIPGNPYSSPVHTGPASDYDDRPTAVTLAKQKRRTATV
jgi:hypothetical protein